MVWIVIDGLVGNAELRPGGQRFAAACIAREARVRAAGYLNANALARAEVVSGWPDRNRDAQTAVGFWRDAARRQPEDAVAQID